MTEARIKVQNNLYILDPIIIPQNCHIKQGAGSNIWSCQTMTEACIKVQNNLNVSDPIRFPHQKRYGQQFLDNPGYSSSLLRRSDLRGYPIVINTYSRLILLIVVSPLLYLQLWQLASHKIRKVINYRVSRLSQSLLCSPSADTEHIPVLTKPSLIVNSG